MDGWSDLWVAVRTPQNLAFEIKSLEIYYFIHDNICKYIWKIKYLQKIRHMQGGVVWCCFIFGRGGGGVWTSVFRWVLLN